MTTRELRAGLLGFVVSILWLGCDGQTFIGTANDGTGGSGSSQVATGSGGHINIIIDASPGETTIITGTDPTTAADAAPGTPTDAAPGTPTDAAPGTPTDAAPGTPTDAFVSGVPDAPPSTCPVAGEANTPTTVDAMRAALVREWILCSPLGLFRRDQVGLQITADDRWALLQRDPTGNVVAQHGVDFEGSVQYLQLGNHVQVNFESDLMFTIISAPVISQQPTVLIINNESVDEYRYVLPDGS